MTEKESIPEPAVEPEVVVVDGVPMTTSRSVAEMFGRSHDDVLRAIRKLRDQLVGDRLGNFSQTVDDRLRKSAETVSGDSDRSSKNGETSEQVNAGARDSEVAMPDRSHYFVETLIERPNPSGGGPIRSPAFRLSEQGFTLLAMGFSGPKAMQFKLAYMDAFDRMSQKLKLLAADDAGQGAALPPAQPARRRGRLPLALPAPAPALSADLQAMVDQRAWAIAGGCHGQIRSWLTDEVLRNCVDDKGRARPNLANTLASATFEGFASDWEAQRVATQLGLLDYLVKELVQVRRGLRARQRKGRSLLNEVR